MSSKKTGKWRKVMTPAELAEITLMEKIHKLTTKQRTIVRHRIRDRCHKRLLRLPKDERDGL